MGAYRNKSFLFLTKHLFWVTDEKSLNLDFCMFSAVLTQDFFVAKFHAPVFLAFETEKLCFDFRFYICEILFMFLTILFIIPVFFFLKTLLSAALFSISLCFMQRGHLNVIVSAERLKFRVSSIHNYLVCGNSLLDNFNLCIYMSSEKIDYFFLSFALRICNRKFRQQHHRFFNIFSQVSRTLGVYAWRW